MASAVDAAQSSPSSGPLSSARSSCEADAATRGTLPRAPSGLREVDRGQRLAAVGREHDGTPPVGLDLGRSTLPNERGAQTEQAEGWGGGGERGGARSAPPARRLGGIGGGLGGQGVRHPPRQGGLV